MMPHITSIPPVAEGSSPQSDAGSLGRWLGIGLALGLLLTTSSSGAEQGTAALDPLCALEGERYRVEVVSEKGCCPNRLGVLVEERGTGERRKLSVEVGMGKSGPARLLPGDRLLITGRLAKDAKSLALVDLEKGKLIDELWAYDYSLSPNKEQLVYVRREVAEIQGEHHPVVLLYDLNKSAAANRVGSSKSLEHRNAGVPIYPAANAEQRSYVGGLDSPHRYLSPFLWSRDGSSVSVFEFHERAYWLVTIDFAPAEGQQAIRRLPVDPESLGKPTQISDKAKRGRVPPLLAYLRWQGEGTISLQALLGGVVQEPILLAAP